MIELGLRDQKPHSEPVLQLLVELPSWPRVFLENLRDLIFPRRLPHLELQSAPAAFWPDVFVKRSLPWYGFLESGAYHLIAGALLVGFTRIVALQPQVVATPTFEHSQVIYYQPSEYLPPIDTRSPEAEEAKPADPEFSRQPIISVPAEADNHSQTIVAPPNIKLKHDVALPNIVAWSDKNIKPQLAIPAVPLTPAADIARLAPQLQSSVVAPAPDASHLTQRRAPINLRTSVVAPPPDLRTSRAATAFDAPQPAVIAPPPSVEVAGSRPVGDLNIGHSSVIAPAPQLALGEQRAIPGGRLPAAAGVTPQVVAPPPSLGASGSAGSPGRVIALSLHPAVGAPPDPPAGNRRGTFAVTPEGHVGASGSPGSTASTAGATGHGAGGKDNGNGSDRRGSNDLPAGLYVGSAAPAKTSPIAGKPAETNAPTASGNTNISPSIPAPRVSSLPARPMLPDNAAKLTDAERAVFGNRKFYSLTLNMPNLNSSGGSWVIRFAELKTDPNEPKGDLSQPTATRKVDPAYPLQMMRENVAGTVILYAVIHADGTVGNVRVLRGVDDRLDQFASNAVAQWQFQPATRNGSPVDVEATFQIPFRPPRKAF